MEKRSEKWFSDDVPARLAEELLENLALNKSEENISIIKNAYDNYLILFLTLLSFFLIFREFNSNLIIGFIFHQTPQLVKVMLIGTCQALPQET